MNLRPRRLHDSARADIEHHLLQLSVTDRYLRFCSALSDYSILQYTKTLHLAGKDVVFGVYAEEQGPLVGMLHVAPSDATSAEFALSVNENMRKNGIGDMLFERGLLHCESVGIKRVYMNCLATNEAIKKMARKRNMDITTNHGESMANLNLKDSISIDQWIKRVEPDTVSLYDLSCKHTQPHWDQYVREVRKLIVDKIK